MSNPTSCRIGGLALACLAFAMPASAADRTPRSGGHVLGTYAPWGVDLAGSDVRRRPGDDFFRYVNGGWLDRMPIPIDRPLVSIDQEIEDGAQDAVRTILEEADGQGPETDLGKARMLYRSFLDASRSDGPHARPLADELEAIRAASTLNDVASLMGRTLGGFGGSLFDVAIRPDPKDTDSYAVTVRQAGLGLPDRSYYLDPSFLPVRNAYRAYLAQILALAGWGEPDAAADSILAFEIAVAEASWSARDARDAALTYNPIALADLARASPYPWQAFLEAAGLGRVRGVIVGQPSAVAALGRLAARAPLATLRRGRPPI